MSSRHVIKQIWHFGFVQYQFVLHYDTRTENMERHDTENDIGVFPLSTKSLAVDLPLKLMGMGNYSRSHALRILVFER